MLTKLKKYFFVFLVGCSIIFGLYMYIKNRQYRNEIADLYNKVTRQAETIEVQKNVYEKKSLEVDDLNSILESLKKDNDLDKDTITKLQKELEKRQSELLAANRLALKWKKAYEAEVEANQTEDPGKDPDDPGDDRIKISFEKDFGYIGVNGYTLTNPPIAWISVKQNRPLFLTMALSQNKDGHWSTLVTSSEDNVEVDVEVSAVNPFVLAKKWYEKLSVDTGIKLKTSGLTPKLGISYPFGPINVSGGLQGDTVDKSVGWYVGLGYLWRPFERKK